MKKGNWKKICLIAGAITVLAVVGLFFLLQRQTYGTYEITKYYENPSTDNPSYIKYLDGILKYTRDGVAYLDKTGEEIWNQPCQMKKSMAKINDQVVAVYDNGGTSILVFDENGLKGEIHTTRPVESLAVSHQGIIAAILKDDDTPLLMCYDAAGNVLVQQNTSLDHTGYPMDVAISDDGKTLLVSYLQVSGNGVSSRVVFYDFGDEKVESVDHQIREAVYEDVLIPVVEYVNKDFSVLVADNELLIYKEGEEPTEVASAPLNDVYNVTHDSKSVAVIVKNAGQSTYQLKVYNMEAELVSEIALERDYSNMEIHGNQILLFEGNLCAIYTKSGICKYEGEVDMEILELFPVFGLNKYMMINANGFYEIRLAK